MADRVDDSPEPAKTPEQIAAGERFRSGYVEPMDDPSKLDEILAKPGSIDLRGAVPPRGE